MAYIGRQNLGGAYRQLDDISSGFDGSDTTHTMQVNSANVTVGDVNQIILSLGGVIQKPGTDFTVSGSVLTFTTAPAANTSFFAVLLGSDNGGTTTPTDLSVSTSKIAANAVTGGKLASDIAIATTADASFGSKVGVNTTHPASGAGLDKFIEVQGADPGIVLRDDTASDAVELYGAGGNFIVYTGSADAFKIDSAGHITKPLQSGFRTTTSDMANLSANTYHTITFATEAFDTNADFDTSTYTFTAPVTGKYFFGIGVMVTSLQTDANYYGIRLTTSNYDTWSYLLDAGGFDETMSYFNMNVPIVTDMDANDTAYVRYYQGGGTGGVSDINSGSWFSGILIG